jgi:hypothetical protein
VSKPTITPEKGAELERLYKEFPIATQRVLNALRIDGAPLEGALLQRVMDEEDKLAAIVRKIKEILGATDQHWIAW